MPVVGSIPARFGPYARMQVAVRAGKREVFLVIVPAVLNRFDVLNLVRNERLVVLPSAAVLAPVVGAFAHAPANGFDHGVRERLMTDRALA